MKIWSKRFPGLVVLGFASWLIAGCSCLPDKAYHPVCAGASSCSDEDLKSAIRTPEKPTFINSLGRDATHDKDASVRIHRADPDEYRETHFQKAYLEYKEDGSPADPPQREAIRNFLRDRDRSRPLFVTVYVHGWHHNANTDTADEGSNAIKFDYLLARIDDSLLRRRADYDILGIYVGWRGERTTTPIATIFSVGDRAAVADKIGSNKKPEGLRSTLQEFAELTRQTHPDSRLLVMGHSFGGRMLSRAFMQDLDRGHAQPLGSRTVINLINPAIGADAYRRAYASENTSSDSQTPAWINLTSSDDRAAGIIFPLAGRVGLLHPDHADGTIQTIGNYYPYITHSIQVVDCSDPATPTLCAPVPALAAMAGNSIWAPGEDTRQTLLFQSTVGPRKTHNYCVQMARHPTSPDVLDKIRQDMSCSNLVAAFTEDNAPSLKARRVAGKGRMWNIVGDSALIEMKKTSLFSNHNAYVQTNWTVLMMDVVFASANAP
ncbi:hypothetical protein [Delftia acidovorans]|uniref:hypothetical protein n=1 Tax=Delftia acidovorans TaxID=80866 RepID=UPI000F824D64|nr:hypothetical protein [Delftia acidovorans]